MRKKVVWSVGRLIRDGCFARLIYGTSLLAEEKQSMQEREGATQLGPAVSDMR
jgi:hypothetical protein